jgi:hypothetical protein
MIKSRKGEDSSINTLVTLIIGIVVLIAIIGTIVFMAARSDEATQNTLCRASVILRGKATVTLVSGVVNMEKLTPIVCRTKNLGPLKGDREQIKKQIANRAAMCWWQFAEGSVQDIFKVERKEKACFVCYTFQITKSLDNGTESLIKFFPEPETRQNNNISSGEMVNYLASVSYNPGVIYGGGTKNYFGTSYGYDIDLGIENPRVIKPSQLTSKLVSGYVMDYGYILTPENRAKIEQMGIDMQKKHAGNLLVITADKFKSMDPSDARGIIESTHLNTNETEYDGLLVMLDLQNETIRVHAGSDLSVFIKDYDINDILENEFKKAEDAADKCDTNKCKVDAINTALVNSLDRITKKMSNEAGMLPGVSPRSFYYYLSNAGQNWPVVDNIQTDKTYVIAYVGVSDENFGGLLRNIVKGWNFIWATPKGDVLEILNKLQININGARPQLLLITDVNSVGDECSQVV